MGDPFGIEMAKVKQEELLREADRRRIARSLWKFRRGEGDEEGPLEGVKVRWGLVGDEPAVADLLELNGLAHALYRGAGELARELGVHEVVVTASRAPRCKASIPNR